MVRIEIYKHKDSFHSPAASFYAFLEQLSGFCSEGRETTYSRYSSYYVLSWKQHAALCSDQRVLLIQDTVVEAWILPEVSETSPVNIPNHHETT